MTEHEPTGGEVVTAPMPLTRFRSLIGTYGAAPERWPESEREAARALLDRSSEARDALADAALLDRLLATHKAPAPSEELVDELDRRFAATRTPARWLRSHWRVPSMPRLARPAVALAGVAAALVVVVLVRNQSAIEPAPPGPTLVQAPPPLELAAGDLDDDDAPLDLEIALIDRSLSDPTEDEPSAVSAGFMGVAVASAPSLEDLPLD